MKKLLPLLVLLNACASGPTIVADPDVKDEVRYYVYRAVELYDKHRDATDSRILLENADVTIHLVDPESMDAHCNLPPGSAAACTRKEIREDAGPPRFTMYVPWDDVHLATHETLHVLMWMNGVRQDRHHLYMIEMRAY